MISHPNRRLVGLRVVLTALSIISWCGLTNAQAPQDVLPEANNTSQANNSSDISTANDSLEEVVVTGSRIRRSGLDTSTPMTVLDRDTLDFSSEKNLGDLLNKIPSMGLADTSSTNSNFNQFTSGASIVNLRNLGAQRTLVLVNGRRHVGGIQGSTAVDLNAIPAEFIERVEIITGGASAIYGSEAISGVVNFILTKDFEGAKANFQYGTTSQSDGQAETIDITFGSQFADDRGNFMVNFSYDNQRQIRTRDRDRGKLDSFQSGDGNIIIPSFSSFTPGGRFFIGSQNTNYTWANEVAGPINSVSELNLVSDLTSVVPYNSTAHGFNRNFFRTIKLPSSRNLISTVINYKISDSITLYNEATASRTESRTLLEPEFISNLKRVSTTGPFITIPVLTDFDPADAIPAAINPLIPDSLAALIDPAVDTELGWRRRAVEWGQRNNRSRRNTFRIVTGLNGIIGDTGWYWDAYFQYGVNSDARVSRGLIDLQRLQQGFNVVEDPSNPGTLICADATARAVGCVPINIFGRNNVSPEAVAWSKQNQMITDEITQKNFVATVSGDIAELASGPIGFAAGIEHRLETSNHHIDSVTVDGRTSDGGDGESIGRYDVNEFFAEIRVPLVADSGIHYLGLEAAIRSADYSTIGSASNSKFGIEFAPIESLKFRAVVAEAIRAPNIGELFASTTSFFASVTDPCSAPVRNTNPTRAANCTALGVPIGYVQQNFELESITGQFFSNRNLTEETADTVTLGAVITPTDDLSITIDYYQIEIDNVIDSFDTQVTANQCVDQSTLNNPFCAFVTRNDSGVIIQVNQRIVNAASQLTEGWDLGVNWNSTFDWGSYQLGAIMNIVETEEFTPFEGADTTSRLGIIVQRGLPEMRLNLRNVFNFGQSSLSVLLRYIDKMKLSEAATVNSPVSAQTYIDMQYRYTFNDEISAFVGLDNLLDETPPRIGTAFNGGLFGTETQPELYDPIGQFLYVGFSVDF